METLTRMKMTEIDLLYDEEWMQWIKEHCDPSEGVTATGYELLSKMDKNGEFV